jgi:arginase
MLHSSMEVAIVKMPFTGVRNVPERSPAPDHLEQDGALVDRLHRAGATVLPVEEITLRAEESAEPGAWHRMGLACGHLGERVADAMRHRRFVVGLLGNCTSLLGMLAGLRRAGHPRAGLLFLDAHADFNTPETTLSGMLGGMPVAVAGGLCLTRLRLEAGLDPPLPAERIVLAGLRDVDPLEKRLLDDHAVATLSIHDLRPDSMALRSQLQRLDERCDAIYVHVDMDVLDSAEVPGHHTAVPGGPGSVELAGVLRTIFGHVKADALGIASTPAGDRDPDGRARQAAHRLIEAAVTSVHQRPTRTGPGPG